MELLFVALFGITFGLVGHALLPLRELRGVLLLPFVGTAVGMVLWVALTWAGWKWNGGWIWTVTITVSILAVAIVGLLATRLRAHADERLFARLVRGTPGL